MADEANFTLSLDLGPDMNLDVDLTATVDSEHAQVQESDPGHPVGLHSSQSSVDETQ
jgi:hypothetical protein